MGAPPDIAVVVDPQYWASRFLDWTTLPRGILVAEPSTNPRAFPGIDAPFFLCSSLFPLGETLEASVGVKALWAPVDSVATSAWDLARLLGARPLYAAGLDLSFPGMRAHCRGVYTEETWFASSSRFLPVEASSFRSVRDIGLFLARSNGRRHDAHGQAHAPLQMVVREPAPHASRSRRVHALSRRDCDRRHAACPHRGGPRIAAAPRGNRHAHGGAQGEADGRSPTVEDELRLHAALKELVSQLAEMESFALQGVDLTRKLRGIVGVNGDPETCLREMDEIDGRILSLSARNIAGFLIQSVIHGISDQGGRTVSADEVVRRSAAIYQGIADSAGLQRSLIARSASALADAPR